MKIYKSIIVLFISGILFSTLLFANENENDYIELTDIVYEWTPYGNMIQVGDYIISEIRSVWLDEGKESMVEVSTSYIEQGKLARVLLIDKDANGFWRADKIIVFSGKGLEKATKRSPY